MAAQSLDHFFRHSKARPHVAQLLSANAFDFGDAISVYTSERCERLDDEGLGSVTPFSGCFACSQIDMRVVLFVRRDLGRQTVINRSPLSGGRYRTVTDVFGRNGLISGAPLGEHCTRR